MATPQSQTIGRGRLYFGKSPDGAALADGERYIGNCTAVEISVAAENIEHFSSESGIRERDIVLEVQRTRGLSITTDNISYENIALLFGADPTVRTTAAITDDGDTLTVQQGLYYQLGKRANRPEGVRTITSVVVRDNSGAKATGTLTFSGQPTAAQTLTINGHVITFVASGATGAQVDIGGSAVLTAQNVKAYVEDNLDLLQVVPSGASTVITLTAVAAGTWANAVDIARSGSYPALSGSTLSGGTNGGAIPTANNWTVNLTTGRLYIEEGGQIADGDTIVVAYNVSSQTQTVVISEDTTIVGSLRFISDNPGGVNRELYVPWVKITPTGSIPLISDTWLSISITGEVMTHPSGLYEQVYWN